MDKEQARKNVVKNILKSHTCITAPDYIAALAIEEYEKLITEDDDEVWRNENIEKLKAGVKFEKRISSGEWRPYLGKSFVESQDKYREAPCQSTIPHAAERALYWKQRAEGRNDVWQYRLRDSDDEYDDMRGAEPKWYPDFEYRPKPKTRTVYLALVRYKSCGLLVGLVNDSKEAIVTDSKVSMFEIIGEIEPREVECD